MSATKLKLKNEILYIIVLLFVTEAFNYAVLRTSFKYLLILGVLALLILELWFVRTFILYSRKKISKYSDVVMKISLKRRFFQYFILPALFYTSLLLFLYFNRNILLGHFVIVICVSFVLLLFLNVKSSLNKYYSVALATRTIFDFICITTLYLLLNSYLRIGFSMWEFIFLSFVSSLVLLISILKIHDKFGSLEFLIAIISSVIVSLSMLAVWNNNILVIPSVGALSFYLITSFWNLRFAGRTKFTDYLYPVVYVLLALSLILTV
ncbi:MAG: hypothetical protein ACOX6Q_00960 [Candidatus Dojkabacteria bacterium]|jgi:hypothetical protein